jgi:hypothetical protein
LNTKFNFSASFINPFYQQTIASCALQAFLRADYVINGNTYIPKKIDLNFTGEYHYLFVKRLTGEEDRMQLYELHQLFKSNDVGEETSYYYISLPSSPMYEAIDINSDKLIPNFENKMAAYVSDCPELADKIKHREKGYNYSFFSLRPKKLEVISRIVKEYNECK